MNWFLDSEIISFIVIILFAAFDFWTVKNVTGRILVGLRWWSEIDEHGKENWIFESNDQQTGVGATDSFVFWTALYGTPLVWAFFIFIDLIGMKFFWLNVAVVCMILSGINLVGYYKCQKDHQKKLTSYIQDKAMGAAMGSFREGILSKIPLIGSRLY